MKYIFLLLITFISSVAFGQTCGPEDTVTANVVSLITSTTARINGTVSQIIADSADGLALRYVRVGQVDTVNSSSGPSSALRNLTGLSPSTQYVYYYKTTCPIGTATQSVAYYFTTLSATVGYVPERPTVFNYLKIDTALTIPQGDTTTARAATTLPQIKYKTSNNTFYGYYPDCICWRPLAIDSSGIIALLDGKVDSVTVSGDSLFYWKVGISYGYILPQAGWDILGNSGLDTSVNWIGTNDAVATKIRSNGLDGIIVGISGGIRMPYLATSGTYYKTVRATSDGILFLGDTLGTTPLSSLTAATATNTINNANYLQTWGWNTHTGLSPAMIFSSNSTALNGTASFASFALSGANSNSNITSTAAVFSNTKTGTTSTNRAASFSSTGGTTNYAAQFQRGIVSFGTVGTESGIIEVNGATSGTVTIQPQAAAGTYNFNIPITAGTSGQPLLSGGGGGTAMTFGTLGLGGGGTGTTDGTGLPYVKLTGTSTLTGNIVVDLNGNDLNIGSSSPRGINLASSLSEIGDWNGNGNGTKITIDDAGQTTVLTATAIQFSTYGAGALTTDASGNITAVSDMRLKNLQGYYKGGISELMKVNPIIYKWNAKSKLEQKQNYIGFSAQNIKEVLGEGSYGINKDGYLSIQDRAIMATLVNAIKEMQVEINELKNQLKNK